MADGTVIVGVVGVLTSGVLGPLVAHHALKDRETIADLRAALDEAIEPLVKVRAHSAWLGATAWGHRGQDAEARKEHDGAVQQRLEDMLHGTHLLDAHAIKLAGRFGDVPLVRAYERAALAANEEAAAIWDRRSGQIALLRDYERRMAQANAEFVASLEAFNVAVRRWHQERQAIHRPFLD